ncbi:retrovirus-related pol polyprotein from transposon TNT 1-94 [Tanacetum coccineum]
MAKASPTQAWLWHRRLSHLKFDTINLLSSKDIVNGLLKLKYVKDHLCSSCELRKAKRSKFKSKKEQSLKEQLNILHMDLCGLMRVESINEKKYILVVADDYSRYIWTHFLRSKDETPEVLIKFLKMNQKRLQATVKIIYQSPQGIFINQSKYALEILKKHGMDKCDSIGTPMATTPKLDADLSDVDHAADAEYVSLSACCAQVPWLSA